MEHIRHDQSGFAQQGYTADEACIALDEESGTLKVMLQAKDASNMEYRNLSKQDQKVFDDARHKDIKRTIWPWSI